MNNTQANIDDIEPARAYLESLRLRGMSPGTLRHRARHLRQFVSFLREQDGADNRLCDVTLEDLERFRARLVARKFSPATVATTMYTLRLLFRYLEERQYIFINPAAALHARCPPKPLQYVPSEKDVRRLLAQPNPATLYGLRDRAVLETLYSTGIRREELVGLSLFDPDPDRGVLRVMGKGRKERFVPLGKRAVFWLREYLKTARPKLLRNQLDEQALWIARGGRPLRAWRVLQILVLYSRRAGIRGITPHALRRACATHMLNRGAHPVKIQALLGHAKLTSLSQYLRVSIIELKKMHGKSKPGR